jgi:hypothetical protein
MLRSATRNRLISLAAVIAYMTAASALAEDADQRAALHSIVVITLGYGHLIGAFWSSRRRRHPGASSDAPGQRSGRVADRKRRALAMLAFAGVVSAFVVFSGSLATHLAVVLCLLAVSAWHTAENDFALEQRYDTADRAEPTLHRLDDVVAPLGVSALLMAAASLGLAAGDGAPDLRERGIDPGMAAGWLRGAAIVFGSALVLRERSPRLERIGLAMIGAAVFMPASLALPSGVTFADVFAATTGYHLVSWIVWSVERARGSDDGADALLVAAHAVPIAVAAACVLSAAPAARELRAAFFAPAPYLFWSVVHVVDTLIQRRRRASPRI